MSHFDLLCNWVTPSEINFNVHSVNAMLKILTVNSKEPLEKKSFEEKNFQGSLISICNQIIKRRSNIKNIVPGPNS